MSTRTPYDRALSLDGKTSGAWVFVALFAHVGGAMLVARHARAASVEPAPIPTEIEFVAAPPPPPPPPPTAEPEVHEDRVVAAAPVAAPRPSTPRANTQVAKAGALVTATGPSDGPVSFASDPDGGEYGSGVVSAHGSGTIGGGPPATTASAAPTVVSAPPPPPPPPPKKPATPPRLTVANACKGFFPASADDDAATVAVAVHVQANGVVTTARVVSESPKGQGFGAAARACVLAQRFEPATGEDGGVMAAAATVNVHFSR